MQQKNLFFMLFLFVGMLYVFQSCKSISTSPQKEGQSHRHTNAYTFDEQMYANDSIRFLHITFYKKNDHTEVQLSLEQVKGRVKGFQAWEEVENNSYGLRLYDAQKKLIGEQALGNPLEYLAEVPNPKGQCEHVLVKQDSGFVMHRLSNQLNIKSLDLFYQSEQGIKTVILEQDF